MVRQTVLLGVNRIERQRTFPAASKPSINIRTSWSLLQRTSDERDVKREEKERPIAAGGGENKSESEREEEREEWKGQQ